MSRPESGGTPEYLCVDEFVADLVGARALASAFEIGLIDLLLKHESCALEDLAQLPMPLPDGRALRLLLGMLRANHVIERVSERRVALTARFRRALVFRDLLESRLEFAALVAPDFLESFTTQLVDPERFFGSARVFELFSYQRCLESTPDNLAHTARWVRLTTALTKYEAQACLDRHDFSAYRRMLDVGGNSGEFALRVCRRHDGLRATVYDLPVVCEVATRHVQAEPEADRISFVRSDGSVGVLPQGHDLVTFKSMLHDWPDEDMQRWLARAHRALEPGGTVLIFERGVLETGDTQLPYAQIPLMLFFRSYRSQEDYAASLAAAGFRDVRCEVVRLDMPFMLITARK